LEKAKYYKVSKNEDVTVLARPFASAATPHLPTGDSCRVERNMTTGDIGSPYGTEVKTA